MTKDDENRVLNLYPIDYPFETLVARVDEKKLILDPDFQRKYKWDKNGNERCSKFIESCLMRIPLPACYFAETKENKHLVIDGVQRITTIKRYLKDEFPLEGLTVFSELNGKKFSQLEMKYQAELESATIRCIILRNDNPEGLVQEIFARLNQGAVILSAQEIRHAINPGSFDNLLVQLAKIDEVKNFKESKKNQGSTKDSRESEELVLRFFALKSAYENDFNNYNDNLSKYMDDFMHQNCNLSSQECEEMELSFKGSLEKCKIVFGDKAFMNLSKSITRQSLILWDLQMISFLSYNLDEITKKQKSIYEAFEELCQDNDFSKTLSARILYKSNIQKRMKLWIGKLESILHRKGEK